MDFYYFVYGLCWMYIECLCGRIEVIINLKLDSKLKMFRSFLIELNRFNLLMQKLERMFILIGFYKYRDDKNILKLIFLFDFIFQRV